MAEQRQNEDAVKSFNSCVPKGLPPRVGRRPKVLYFCTNPENLTKRVSSGYLDADGKVNKVEFLGNGQQFVTWGDHPETGKPYKYSSAKALHDTPMSELSAITAEQIDAEQLHIDYDTLGIYLVRMDIGKENFAISAAGATWFKLCSVILPNGEPGELGDDMGVHQPYDVTVHAQEAEEVNVAQRSEILAKRRLDILNAVGGEFNGRLSELYGQLGDMWGIKSRQSIIDRVGTAVGLGKDKSVLVETGVGVFKLWREQRGTTSPTTLHIAKFQA